MFKIKVVLILFSAFTFASCSVESRTEKQKEPVLYFEMNLDTLSKEQLKLVDSVGKFLKDNPKAKVDVIGLAHPNEIEYKNEPHGIAFKRCEWVGLYNRKVK